MHEENLGSKRLTPSSRLTLMQSAKALIKLAAATHHFHVKAQTFRATYVDKTIASMCSKSEVQTTHLRPQSKKHGSIIIINPSCEEAFRRTYCWNELIREAQHTNHLMRKSVTHAKVIVRELEKVGVVTSSQIWRDAASATLRSEWEQKKVIAVLVRYGLSADAATAALEIALKGDFQAMLQNVVTLTDGFGKTIKSFLRSKDEEEKKEEKGFFEEAAEKTGWAALGAAVAAFVNWLLDVVNDPEDDIARDKINSRTCPEVAAIPLDEKVQMIRDMLSGPTGDDDEQAILRLLQCSARENVIDCGQVREIVGAVGLTNLLNEFHGEEWDRLTNLLNACGLLGFSNFDDDASRLFIRNANCSTLNSLPISDINQLIRNLFAGATGDDDENAIITLIGCLPCNRRLSLLAMPGTAFNDFRDEFHGEEWEHLRSLLEHCKGDGSTRKIDEEGELVSVFPDGPERTPREPR